ncbi:MAG: hypothetical protein JXM71_04885 [Spirochaetales bacterium]|nr:hypothetical protein [Spirochaetales bacterium]
MIPMEGSAMRLKRLSQIVMLAALSSSCSYVLDSVLAPFAPDFLPTLGDVAGGIQVGNVVAPASTPASIDEEGEQQSWSMDYAMYVYRSEESPYAGMELVGRSFLANAAWVWTGYEATVETVYDAYGVPLYDEIVPSYPTYDFTLTAGYDAATGIVNEEATSAAFIDTTAPSGTLYYRLARVTLYRNVWDTTLTLNTYDENGVVTGSREQDVTEWDYSLSPSASGWASITNTP